MKQLLSSENLSIINIPKLSKIWVDIDCLSLQNSKWVANLEIVKTEEESLIWAIIPSWDKLPWYKLFINKHWSLTCLQILWLFPEIENKLWINFQYLISTLSQSIKIAIVKLLKMYPKDEQNKVLDIIYSSAIHDWIPEEFINQIRDTKITTSLHSRNVISRVNKRKDNILESLNIKHDFFDIMRTEFKYLFEKSLYMRWEQLIYDYLKIFSVSDRARLINKYENNPEFVVKTCGNWNVTISRNKYFIKEWSEQNISTHNNENLITIKPITEEQLMSKTQLIKNNLRINYWKKLLQRTKSHEEKVIILHDAVESLNKIIQYFPWNNADNCWQNPVDIVKTKEMQCVWKAIVSHIFLDKLWIKHKWCYQISHVALIIYIDWKEYLFDTNVDELWSCPEISWAEKDWKMFVCTSLANWDTWRLMRYQLVDAEQMCFWAIANNIIQDNPIVFQQISAYHDLLLYFRNKPCITHNINLGSAYMQFWDLDKAIFYYQKELEIDAESHITYANLGKCYYLKKQFLESYLSFLDAIYYWFDINSLLNYQEHLEELRTSQYFTSRKSLTAEQNEFIESFLTNKNWKLWNQNPKDNYLKALSIDPTNENIWYLIYQNAKWKQKVIARFLNEYFENHKIIFDSESFKYYRIETKDLFYQFIKLHYNQDYDGMFDLFCSLEGKD